MRAFDIPKDYYMGPTAMEVAIAIVAASREYYEDPLDIANGVCARKARSAAFCALELCFPEFDKRSLIKMVGGASNFLSTFRRGWPKNERTRAYRVQWQIAEKIVRYRQTHGFDPLRVEGMIPGAINMRKKPSVDVENNTSAIMGDPSPGKSALDKRGASI